MSRKLILSVTGVALALSLIALFQNCGPGFVTAGGVNIGSSFGEGDDDDDGGGDVDGDVGDRAESLGIFGVLAGNVGGSGNSDGTGSDARFHDPYGVAVDSAGNVFVTDIHNYTIRKITPEGAVTTLAGLAGAPGSADGTGSDARFYTPFGIAVDSAGNVFVTDAHNQTIRKITPQGAVTTFAGLTGFIGSADGRGSDARFYFPHGIAVDSAGNVFVADTFNHTIRKITPQGAVTTFAGLAGARGSADGTGSDARFNNPYGIAVDSAGNVFAADLENHTIRKITSQGAVTTFAGLARIRGSADGTASDAQFYYPRGIAVDSAGNVFVADSENHTIRKITPQGAVTTFAGLARSSGSADGTGSDARFNGPAGIAVDSAGNVFVGDFYNHIIRKITPQGAVTTFAGLAGARGSTDGTGSDARFNYPRGIAVDSAGNVFVTDAHNQTIRKITPQGAVTALNARFYFPHGISVDSAGNVFVADTFNHTIRKITPQGAVTTFAGLAGSSGSADGTGSDARFSNPRGIAVDSAGNFFVADTDNHTIRKITPQGLVSTIIGTAGVWGGNFSLLPGVISSPEGVAVMPSGDLVFTTNNGVGIAPRQ